MASSSNYDPLGLAELDPEKIQSKIDGRDKKASKAPSELELQKEARLAEKEQRLNKGLAPSAGKKAFVPSEVPPPAPQPPKDRSVLLDKISAYRERFPHLKKRNTLSGKSTLEEIEDMFRAQAAAAGRGRLYREGGGPSYGTIKPAP